MAVRVALAAIVACLALPQAVAARPLLGVTGNPDRFEKLTGQHSTVVQKVVGWGQGDTWGSSFGDLFATMGDVPLLSMTMNGKSGAPAIDSRRIANGAGDAYLALPPLRLATSVRIGCLISTISARTAELVSFSTTGDTAGNTAVSPACSANSYGVLPGGARINAPSESI